MGKDDPLFCPGIDGIGLVRALGQVFVSCSSARLDRSARRGVYALSPGGLGHRTLDLLGREEPICRQPTDAFDHFPAGGDAVGISVRSSEHAGGSSIYHLLAAGPLLRESSTDDFSRRR